jgi:hypothetical protein
MKRLIAALGFTFLAFPALAMTTLNTSMIDPGGDSVVCNVVNVSSKVITVTISVINAIGAVLESGQASAMPGNGINVGVKSPVSLVYCSFVFSGSSKSMRGSLEVVDQSTGNPVATLPAS